MTVSYTIPACLMVKRRKVSQKEFDRRIKLWTVLVPLIVALISSLTTIWVTFHSTYRNMAESKIGGMIPAEDLKASKKLTAEIMSLMADYYQAKDPIEKEKLNTKLLELANAEAIIMRRHIEDYQPLWPKID